MILNINGERRINYDNVVDEIIIKRNGGSIKIKFTFTNNQYIVLLMSENQYEEFKHKTSMPSRNSVIDITCSIVQSLNG